MADTNGTIDYNSRTAATTLSVGSVTLRDNDALTLAIGSGFPNPAGTQITLIEFWNEIDPERGSTLMGSWNSAGTGIAPEGVRVTADGTGVRISDDALTEDVSYYYNVVATDSGATATYSADPELIIRRTTNPRRSNSTAAPEARP